MDNFIGLSDKILIDFKLDDDVTLIDAKQKFIIYAVKEQFKKEKFQKENSTIAAQITLDHHCRKRHKTHNQLKRADTYWKEIFEIHASFSKKN